MNWYKERNLLLLSSQKKNDNDNVLFFSKAKNTLKKKKDASLPLPEERMGRTATVMIDEYRKWPRLL